MAPSFVKSIFILCCARRAGNDCLSENMGWHRAKADAPPSLGRAEEHCLPQQVSSQRKNKYCHRWFYYLHLGNVVAWLIVHKRSQLKRNFYPRGHRKCQQFVVPADLDHVYTRARGFSSVSIFIMRCLYALAISSKP